jgi:hypothetical protein
MRVSSTELTIRSSAPQAAAAETRGLSMALAIHSASLIRMQ